MADKPYWFAAHDDEQGSKANPWTPALHCSDTHQGLCPDLGVWFATAEECEQFIRDEILGIPLKPNAEFH